MKNMYSSNSYVFSLICNLNINAARRSEMHQNALNRLSLPKGLFVHYISNISNLEAVDAIQTLDQILERILDRLWN